MIEKLKTLWKQFTRWLESLLPGLKQPELEEEQEPESLQRLAPGYVGTLVHCTTCGVLHELEAVCHVCGAPVCSDQRYCRQTREDLDLGLAAVTCANCAGIGSLG